MVIFLLLIPFFQKCCIQNYVIINSVKKIFVDISFCTKIAADHTQSSHDLLYLLIAPAVKDHKSTALVEKLALP